MSNICFEEARECFVTLAKRNHVLEGRVNLEKKHQITRNFADISWSSVLRVSWAFPGTCTLKNPRCCPNWKGLKSAPTPQRPFFCQLMILRWSKQGQSLYLKGALDSFSAAKLLQRARNKQCLNCIDPHLEEECTKLSRVNEWLWRIFMSIVINDNNYHTNSTFPWASYLRQKKIGGEGYLKIWRLTNGCKQPLENRFLPMCH